MKRKRECHKPWKSRPGFRLWGMWGHELKWWLEKWCLTGRMWGVPAPLPPPHQPTHSRKPSITTSIYIQSGFYHWQWVTIMIVSLQCRWYQQMCSPKLWLRHSKRFVTIAQCDNSHFQFRLRDIWLVQVNLHWGKFVCLKIYTILSHSIMYLLPPLKQINCYK